MKKKSKRQTLETNNQTIHSATADLLIVSLSINSNSLGFPQLFFQHRNLVVVHVLTSFQRTPRPGRPQTQIRCKSSYIIAPQFLLVQPVWWMTMQRLHFTMACKIRLDCRLLQGTSASTDSEKWLSAEDCHRRLQPMRYH